MIQDKLRQLSIIETNQTILSHDLMAGNKNFKGASRRHDLRCQHPLRHVYRRDNIVRCRGTDLGQTKLGFVALGHPNGLKGVQ